MEGQLSVVRIPVSTRYNPFELGITEKGENDTVFCVERSEYGCFHEYKAPYIMKQDTHSVFDVSYKGCVPKLSDSSGDIFIVPYEVAEKERPVHSLCRFIARRMDFDNTRRYIYIGDEASPSYDVFLLFAFPAAAFIYRNNELVDVSSESMRRLSYRSLLASIAPKCKKVGCLLDSRTGVNEQIIHQISTMSFKLGYKIYCLSIGKIEDYKLGNFPDIDLFVNLQCQFCFNWRKKYIKPVLSYYDFVSGVLDCFWEFPYGDYNSLLIREGHYLVGGKAQGLIQNQQSDFSQSFSCKAQCVEIGYNQEDTKIETGLFGIPKSYEGVKN